MFHVFILRLTATILNHDTFDVSGRAESYETEQGRCSGTLMRYSRGEFDTRQFDIERRFESVRKYKQDGS